MRTQHFQAVVFIVHLHVQSEKIVQRHTGRITARLYFWADRKNEVSTGRTCVTVKLHFYQKWQLLSSSASALRAGVLKYEWLFLAESGSYPLHPGHRISLNDICVICGCICEFLVSFQTLTSVDCLDIAWHCLTNVTCRKLGSARVRTQIENVFEKYVNKDWHVSLQEGVRRLAATRHQDNANISCTECWWAQGIDICGTCLHINWTQWCHQGRHACFKILSKPISVCFSGPKAQHLAQRSLRRLTHEYKNTWPGFNRAPPACACEDACAAPPSAGYRLREVIVLTRSVECDFEFAPRRSRLEFWVCGSGFC